MDQVLNVPLEQLRRRQSMKWFMYPQDVVPAWIAEMDCELAPPVRQALLQALELGDMGYPNRPEYLLSLQRFLRAQLDWDVPVDNMRSVGDVMTGIAILIQLLSGPGESVVISPPVYAPFYDVVKDTGRALALAPLGDDGRLDLATIERAFETGGRVYLLSNPHNPTGVVHTAAELAALAELAERHGVWVISDEIHAPLMHPGSTFVPYLSVPGAQRAVAVHSPSKAFNLAGVKAAVIVGSERALAEFARWTGNISGGVSHLGVIAQIAAMESGSAWLDQLRTELERNRRLLGELLTQHLPQVGYRQPEGTYLAWLDCRGLGFTEPASQVFLDRGRVALSGGQGFGEDWGHHVRLNFATSPQILEEIVTRMSKATR